MRAPICPRSRPSICWAFREQHSGDAAAAIYRFLNREGLIGGEALEEAKREFKSQERDRLVRVALQEAWRQVLGDPQGLLRDLLAETVSEISGHVPDRGEIAEFLQGYRQEEVPKSSRLSGRRPTKITVLQSTTLNNLYRE